MPTLIKDFGPDSVVATYRYDDPPAIRGEHRSCVISIALEGGTGGNFRYRLKGYARAVSDLCGGRHVRLFRGDDPQLEYEQFSFVTEAAGKPIVVFCSEVEYLVE
jgi:hypothetical protein